MNQTMLNIGCGSRKLPGFINLDLEPGADLQVDVTKGLPFPRESVRAIICEHFIEHLAQADGFGFLRECRRVLEPGGVLRIATPDLDAVIESYRGDWRDQAWLKQFGYEWIETRAEMLNITMREWGHQWVYNQEELVRMAALAGLALKGSFAPGQSDVPELRGLEYRDDSFVVELVRQERRAGENEPLVSVLIPAYTPNFFAECLESARHQTYLNLEIIVSDDSPNGLIGEIVKKTAEADPRIKYFRNEPALGSRDNYLRLFELATGEYIKYLNDDDLLLPHCVERMVRCLREWPGVTLVTSHRQPIDAAGGEIPDMVATLRPVDEDSLLDGVAAASAMLGNMVNFIGEPTTAMFRRADLAGTWPDLFSVGGRQVFWNADVALWTNLLSKGDLIYLVETLSQFRQHPGQEQQLPQARERGVAAWQQLRADAARLGLLGNRQPYDSITPLNADGTGLTAVEPAAVAFDGDSDPVVSIIIPTYNKWEFTARCLDAVRRNSGRVPVEIIVVDNASTDATREALRRVGSLVRVQLNEENVGFARACNQGAALAKGKYLVFLNNDTEARPGWLEALVDMAETDASVSIVGSKLLFPDGTIQHAGVGFAYAGPYPINPLHFNYRMPAESSQRAIELRAVTAACMLVRTADFWAVGGFDEQYVNGYEDIDFCLRLREIGGRVMYNPASVVVHHESVSEGRYLKESSNLDLFHRRWMGKFSEFDHNDFAGVTPPPVSPERPGVSIVVLTYNSLATIARCLESLYLHTGPQDEVIVVDNASRDATLRVVEGMVERRPGWLRIIKTGRNLGFSRGTNVGIQNATKEFVALVNPDVEVTPGWLDRLTAHLGDPQVGAVGPTADYVAGLQKVDQYLDPKAYPNPPAISDALAARHPGQARETRLLIGFCLLTRRSLLSELGGLDPELFLGNDDLDLSLQLRERGLKLLVATDVFVRHFGQVSFRTEPSKKTTYLVQQSTNALYEKLWRERAGKVPASDELWGMSWFAPQTGRASIIMLIHNNLEVSRQCIESVYEHTQRDFELILVDNGSTDDVAGCAADLAERYGNVKFIRNEANQGYAFGCNQGLAAATGEYLVLLNNDVVVTEGWLSRLIALVSLDPAIAMAGPRTNCSAGLQQVDGVTYTDLAGMHRFADDWFVDHAGQFDLTARITGVCMVARREALAKVGGFDTGFGVGNFEDDDLCLRLVRAGYVLAIANDVFVHHYGSSTFKALKVDYQRLMEENFRIFAHKWGHAGTMQGGYNPLALAQAEPFNAQRDHIPFSYRAVFHPGAVPLDLPGAREVRLLSVPDWSNPGWRETVKGYAGAFGAQDPVSLVIRVEPPTSELVEAAYSQLSSLLEECGDGAEAPDIVLETTPLAPRERGGLYTAVTALLRCPGGRAGLYEREAVACGVPVIDSVAPEELRRLVGMAEKSA